MISQNARFRLVVSGTWGMFVILNDISGSFAVGRTTKTTVERFNKETGDFIDELDDSGPYTVVMFDSKVGVLGIAKKSKLAPNAATIARRVKELLSK